MAKREPIIAKRGRRRRAHSRRNTGQSSSTTFMSANQPMPMARYCWNIGFASRAPWVFTHKSVVIRSTAPRAMIRMLSFDILKATRGCIVGPFPTELDATYDFKAESYVPYFGHSLLVVK